MLGDLAKGMLSVSVPSALIVAPCPDFVQVLQGCVIIALASYYMTPKSIGLLGGCMKRSGLYLISILVFMAAACDGAAWLSRPVPTTEPSTSTPSPEVAATPTSVQELNPGQHTQARVVRIIDGDTIEVELGGLRHKVRYIGIDCPEPSHPPATAEPFSAQATARNAELVAGKTVRLEKDISETDRHGRLLRYVWVGDTLVNEALVCAGLCRAVRYPPDVTRQSRLTECQREAQRAGRGLWAGRR